MHSKKSSQQRQTLQKFGDIREWKKPETVIDKIQKWKEFRYDEKTNPNGKWFDYKKNMGKLYSWVYSRKKDKQKMISIMEHFNKDEISELEKEGFQKEITNAEHCKKINCW